VKIISSEGGINGSQKRGKRGMKQKRRKLNGGERVVRRETTRIGTHVEAKLLKIKGRKEKKGGKDFS